MPAERSSSNRHSAPLRNPSLTLNLIPTTQIPSTTPRQWIVASGLLRLSAALSAVVPTRTRHAARLDSAEQVDTPEDPTRTKETTGKGVEMSQAINKSSALRSPGSEGDLLAPDASPDTNSSPGKREWVDSAGFRAGFMGMAVMILYAAFNVLQSFLTTLFPNLGFTSLIAVYTSFGLSSLLLAPALASPSMPVIRGDLRAALACGAACISAFLWCARAAAQSPSEADAAPLLIVGSCVAGLGSGFVWVAAGSYVDAVAREAAERGEEGGRDAAVGKSNAVFFGIFNANGIIGNIAVLIVLLSPPSSPANSTSASMISVLTACACVGTLGVLFVAMAEYVDPETKSTHGSAKPPRRLTLARRAARLSLLLFAVQGAGVAFTFGCLPSFAKRVGGETLLIPAAFLLYGLTSCTLSPLSGVIFARRRGWAYLCTGAGTVLIVNGVLLGGLSAGVIQGSGSKIVVVVAGGLCGVFDIGVFCVAFSLLATLATNTSTLPHIPLAVLAGATIISLPPYAVAMLCVDSMANETKSKGGKSKHMTVYRKAARMARRWAGAPWRETEEMEGIVQSGEERGETDVDGQGTKEGRGRTRSTDSTRGSKRVMDRAESRASVTSEAGEVLFAGGNEFASVPDLTANGKSASPKTTNVTSPSRRVNEKSPTTPTTRSHNAAWESTELVAVPQSQGAIRSTPNLGPENNSKQAGGTISKSGMKHVNHGIGTSVKELAGTDFGPKPIG
ncbi:hypothetical protein M427DRAFT_27599 [Gonapodya prolifera JEL478]|uniref:MFS general substrate transporter n=1 Tax=Gonapodya prolifera (strain JEL478) TaxID=1344416 RepID=A0A139AWR0_GONPJ|nr:hypothetical protein M427DRAFT_27599 [Gonapodya prolifera JEL478]|eukprot:KXS21160.1 hypothetical protein M427DRAFT_27599 [Gonapodya prolifera JEL478]